MSRDHELANEWTRCRGKNANYITMMDIYRAANNCFTIYHISWIINGPKSNFICDNILTNAILFFFGCSEVNSTWLIPSELANQRAQNVLFTCVVYINVRWCKEKMFWKKPKDGSQPLYTYAHGRKRERSKREALAFFASVQLSRDSLRAFNDQIKIHRENRGLWTF